MAAVHFSQLGSPTEGASWRREGGRKLNALSSRQTSGRYSQVLLLADLHGDLAQAAAALQVLGATGQVSCGWQSRCDLSSVHTLRRCLQV